MNVGRGAKTGLWLMTWLLLSAANAAQADYGTLLRQLEDYQPPTILAPAPPNQPAAATEPAAEDFQRQAATLRDRQEEWLKALAAPSAETLLPPDLALLETLRPAATDDSLAAQALAKAVSVEGLQALVWWRSPSLQAKEAELRAVLEGYGQAENLDTILRRYAGFSRSLMPGVVGMTDPDPVALKFPFPGLLALKGEIVGQEAEAAWQSLTIARREALTAIRRDHAELLYAHQAVALTTAQGQLLDTLRQAVASRYQAGTANFTELTAVDIEQEKLRESLTTLREGQKNRETVIRAALVLPPTMVIGPPAPPPSPPSPRTSDELIPLALEKRQELKAQRAEIGRLERMLAMAETMTFPGYNQGLSLWTAEEISQISAGGMKNRDRDGGATDTNDTSFPLSATASSGLGLPKLPWFGTDNATLRQSRQRLLAMELGLRAMEAATTVAVREAWFRLDQARREGTLYRERVLPLAKANLDAATQAYASNSSDFTALIEAANGWLKANLARARAEADQQQAAADLDNTVGVGIKR